MANAFTKAILNDGYRNAIVKLTGKLDTANAGIAPAIQLSDFVSNDPNNTFVGLRVDEINYTIGQQISVELAWQATTPQQIALLYGFGKLRNLFGSGMVPDRTAAGYNGNINLATTGWASGIQDYTLILRMVKLYDK